MNWLAALFGWFAGSAATTPLPGTPARPQSLASLAPAPQPAAPPQRLPASQRRTSPRGIAAIKSHEGLRLAAYLDAVGVWTIGYGHTRTAKQGLRWTQEQAERAFLLDIGEAEAGVRRYVQAPLTQGEFDALVSFVFNFGPSKFARSTLLKVLNAGDYRAAAGWFEKWVYGVVNGRNVKLAGLVKRRADEKQLFLS